MYSSIYLKVSSFHAPVPLCLCDNGERNRAFTTEFSAAIAMLHFYVSSAFIPHKPETTILARRVRLYETGSDPDYGTPRVTASFVCLCTFARRLPSLLFVSRTPLSPNVHIPLPYMIASNHQYCRCHGLRVSPTLSELS